jgi:alpha,alpha-trehalose phosphorylase
VVAIDVLEPGQRLRLVKLAAYGWSHERTQPAMRAQVGAALRAAGTAGWDTLLSEQRGYLDDFWATGDVELDGDPELQQAVRFALYQVLSAGARGEGRAIPAKGLTGTGYDGHSFWDTELFILPALTYTSPGAAADALRWRHSTLPAARQRARALGLAGAAFPWRTINGEECSAYWPGGTAAFHVNADIAGALINYVSATGDEAFERDVGIEILVETARLWRSLGHYDVGGSFRIDGVTGPDEYSAICDNNVYTNLMARRNLYGAASACRRHRDRARETRPDQYPLLLHFPYFDLYRRQVVKQPDLVLAMLICSQSFSPEQRARNFEYYDRITVRDSSLAACTEAVAAADTGHLRLALDYAAEAALMDLDDFEHNARDGLHVASLGGAWIAFVAGFGGMRDDGEKLAFRPRLPDGLTRLAFSILWRGSALRVEVTTREARYELTRGQGEVSLLHHGEPLSIAVGHPGVRPIPAAPDRPPPTQPLGRAPRQRSPG